MNSSFEENAPGSPQSPISRAFAEFWDQVMLSNGLKTWTVGYTTAGPSFDEASQDGQVPRSSPLACETAASTSTLEVDAQLPDADVLGFAASSFDEAFAEIEQNQQPEKASDEVSIASETEMDAGDNKTGAGQKRSYDDTADQSGSDSEGRKYLRAEDDDGDDAEEGNDENIDENQAEEFGEIEEIPEESGEVEEIAEVAGNKYQKGNGKRINVFVYPESDGDD
ncbi:germ cell nuclear acidic protein-like [Paramacrobiotus metropolitanus]|uniref:germ cell nuclear acidic protein-like n=1 Tax=Paramacrobiotus metropolitanus TaxID=2943436 RepID=UPI002445F9F6|nr:germ cell nuclear acidic protein-like [Paramacrobiotus metropolitanus]XP_055336440.1 germ cell nuclear acidic protein-like [Paramacrobiotus metropolitanus]